jgi:hypothetical protein
MRKYSAWGCVLLGLAILSGCAERHDSSMRPGSDCLTCHDGAVAPRWSVAGTVFPCAGADVGAGVAGVTVVITDDAGTELLRLTSNGVGNFYSVIPLPSAIRASVQRNGARQAMPAAQSLGACNSCHAIPAQGGAPGRLYIDSASCGATGAPGLAGN